MGNVFIITWNEEKWPRANMQSLMDRFARGESVVERWKMGAYRKCGIGDAVFLSRVGKISPGLLASGTVASDTWKDDDFEEPSKVAWYANVRFDFFAASPLAPVVSPYELEARLGIPARAFTPQKSGTPYSGDSDQLLAYWHELTGRSEFMSFWELADDRSAEYQEGALKRVYVNRYERDPAARAACLRAHGYSCKACGLNMALVYGPLLGRNFIHVHHLTPLSKIGPDYKLDPVAELVPLCPNCHAMVHREDPPLSIEKLRANILPRYRDLHP